MSYIIVDVESDGPILHKYSMVCFGAVVPEPSLEKSFMVFLQDGSVTCIVE